ncbi:hypothetical protein [Paraprevotella clara]|uniref:hypothetical protein n=1 Tax=Paraprevotella clara TaxID=454154 RepID=UPI0011C11824|nr:hypothetical protein [Paraprevotella clara]
MFTDTGIFLFARSAFNKVVNQFSKIHATLPLHLSSPPPSPTVILTSYNYWKGVACPNIAT